jgi:putative transposase
MQIVIILQSHEVCRKVKEICSEHSISELTFYNYNAKYGGMEVSDVRRIKDLEDEYARLKDIVANIALEIISLVQMGGTSTSSRTCEGCWGE